MRFLVILVLVLLSCLNAEALKKRQLEQTHAGYCPMHKMICNVYCPPVLIDLSAPKPVDGCTRDSHCMSNEKCCQPACGCTNQCTKALEKPGFDTSF